MSGLGHRRVAAGAALVVGLLAAAGGYAMFRPRHDPTATPVPHGALQVQVGAADTRDADQPALRCFVDGKFVGALATDECARRNGAASKALDVGLPPAPPPAETAALVPDPGETSPASVDASMRQASSEVDHASTADVCLRAAGSGWRVVGRDLPLGACAHALFADRCLQPGQALYGRAGPLVLRLAPGRVESSTDGRRFSLLMAQNDDCSLDE